MFQDDGPEKANSDVPGDVADDVPVAQETVQVIPGSKLLWRIDLAHFLSQRALV